MDHHVRMRTRAISAVTVLSTLLGSVAERRLGAASPPTPRTIQEVESVLSRSPGPPPGTRLRDIRIVLVANEKDHGPEEHDYPLWLARWGTLLGGKGVGDGKRVTLFGPGPSEAPPEALSGAPAVSVSMAQGWPQKDALENADVVVAFIGTGGRWSEDRIEDVRRLLGRGAGFVAVHSAVITSRELSGPLAGVLGLAWEDGTTTFRHGPVELRIAAPDHPIALGLPGRMRFEDESYWPLVGDASKVEVLATADESVRGPEGGSGLAPQPMFWTRQVGKGRVYGCILGHYTWTFDDPYFRLLLLRGIAWAARESPYRFDPLVLRGARVRDESAPTTVAIPPPGAPPVPPDPREPALLLWLDAGDRSTLTVDPDGCVSDWSSRTGRGLSSWGPGRPLFLEDGPGGRPAVRFDGRDDILRDTGFRRAAKDWTLFIVATIRSNEGGFRALFSASKTGVNDYLSGLNLDLGGGASSLLDTLNIEGSQHQGQCNLKVSPAPFGTLAVTVVRHGAETKAWVNGAEEGSRASADAVASLDEIRIGGRIFENPPGTLPLGEHGFLDGDISEVVFFAEALGEEKRLGIEAYLQRKYGAALTRSLEPTLEEAWAALPAYEVSKGRFALGPIDAAMVSTRAGTDARREIEDRLVGILSGASTHDAKDFVCRRLGAFGTSRSVPALAALLADDRLSHPARIALERIAGPEAVAALRAALTSAKGKVRAGIATSLASLRDGDSVPRIASLLDDPDPDVASAAAAALGRLGAAGPLRARAPSATARRAQAIDEALLDAGYALLAERKPSEAAGVFRELLARTSVAIRVGALRGLARAAPDEAEPILLKASREDADPRLRAAAKEALGAHDE